MNNLTARLIKLNSVLARTLWLIEVSGSELEESLSDLQSTLEYDYQRLIIEGYFHPKKPTNELIEAIRLIYYMESSSRKETRETAVKLTQQVTHMNIEDARDYVDGIFKSIEYIYGDKQTDEHSPTI